MISGLEMAEKYYQMYGRTAIDQVLASFPQVKPATGLCGEGSQCLGFDDLISQDHDFAPGFCIWLSEEDFATAGAALQAAYDALPSSFMGCNRDNIIATDRLGVMTVGSFYRRFTGCAGSREFPGLPTTNIEWLMIPEHCLAAATNGKVFRDDAGTFSKIRKTLLNFYPEDILRKKIAARAAVLSQAGQYNLLRVIRRNDLVAAMLSAARFSEAALSMTYLLNRRYMPFYKWAFHGVSLLPHPEPAIARLKEFSSVFSLLEDGKSQAAYEKAFSITEEICAGFAKELREQNFSAAAGDFLQDHLAQIMSGIQDPQIASLPPIADYN